MTDIYDTLVEFRDTLDKAMETADFLHLGRDKFPGADIVKAIDSLLTLRDTLGIRDEWTKGRVHEMQRIHAAGLSLLEAFEDTEDLTTEEEVALDHLAEALDVT